MKRIKLWIRIKPEAENPYHIDVLNLRSGGLTGPIAEDEFADQTGFEDGTIEYLDSRVPENSVAP